MKLLLFCLLLCPVFAVAQQQIINVERDSPYQPGLYTIGGQPVLAAKYIRVVEGSPYYGGGWMKGNITLSGGREYKDQVMRLDLAANAVEYIDAGQELIVTTPLREVTLIDSISGASARFLHSAVINTTDKPTPGWYQVLQIGTATVFKLMIKSITESIPYGQATYEQRIMTQNHYFILHGTSFTKVKKFKEIPEILSDKKKELENHISKNKLTGKTDADYISLLNYYSSLQLQ